MDTRDRHPDIAELRHLLDILGVLTTGFGAFSLIVGLDASDLGATRAGMLLVVTGLCFVLIRLRIDRVRVGLTVGATAATIVAAAITLTLVEPIYSVFAIVPLLAVGVALPYLRGRVLGTIMVAACIVAFGINVVLETSTKVSLLSPEAQAVIGFGGFLAGIGVFLLQLWRFSSRLHAALDQATAAERSRADSEIRYGALVDRLAGVVYMSSSGADAPIYYVSPQIEAMMGYTPEEWLAGSDDWIPGYGLWASRIHAEDRERVLVERADRLTVADSHTWEYRLLTKAGRELWVRDDKTVVQRHADGRPKLIQGLMVDITEQKGLEAQLSHQAFHDALTGLPNRTYFTEQVTAAIARARRSGQGMVVVYLDLDDFKVVNDTFGHGVGDRLLVDVARRLRETIRATDLAARVGGDEFNLLLEGFTDEIAADDMVRRLLVVLSESYRIENHDVRIRATAGIAGLGSADYTVEDLQRNADAALYEAKAEGKSRQAWFDPAMGARASDRVEIENGLRRAIELGEIEVAYQSVVDLRTGLITGVEALARWRHPERGAVPPSEFIPVAERAGLIVELGRFVLREACLASVRLAAAAGHQPVPVSVNVSARQIVDADFVADVRSALAAAGLAAEHLTLELTESILILDSERTDLVVAALKGLGVRLAIDDFGTGHSSLSYARRFPVDELKIDRSFIDGLGRSREDAAIVTAAIAFARALRLDVTAEGVETPDQAIRLRALGCDRAQGYLFARPMDEAALAAILREGGLSALNELGPRLQAS
jgi:diguanylate cyclase (GGDEF)-like protein/PAS domain S-box-containing protein